MSIPLDRLYNFLANQAGRDMLIYRWSPHGSKKPENLRPLTHYKQDGDRFGATNPIMICHDQEPLRHELYGPSQMYACLRRRFVPSDDLDPVLQEIAQWGLKSAVELFNVYDRVILLHSEQNSDQLDQSRRMGFLPVYYWSHAIIALDWFRYAQHDPVLQRPRSITKDFLIYNRAWSGSREYRLGFAAGLIDKDLVHHCQTTFSEHCDSTHYTDHQFVNPTLQIYRTDIQQHFSPCTAMSAASADYNNQDYRNCMIEVVLETLMDDRRWHLTEKILRPIACGMPFLLASTPGSLEYLRYYGFRTFDPVIDETYDGITGTKERLDAVQQEMQRIANLPQSQRQDLSHELDEIARYNQRHFFSREFYQQVCAEYKHNLSEALTAIETYREGRQLTKVKQLFDSVPSRSPQQVSRINTLYETIKYWNQDPGSVPGNW